MSAMLCTVWSLIGMCFITLCTCSSAYRSSSGSVFSMCKRDRVSATGISCPGLYVNLRSYGMMASIIRCNLCGASLIGILKMFSNGLWSLMIETFLPNIYWWKCLHANTMPSSSFSIWEYLCLCHSMILNYMLLFRLSLVARLPTLVVMRRRLSRLPGSEYRNMRGARTMIC